MAALPRRPHWLERWSFAMLSPKPPPSQKLDSMAGELLTSYISVHPPTSTASSLVT